MSVAVDLDPRRPLGRSQELIWTAQRLRPDVPLANMAHVYRISGRIDPDRFVAAFDAVVRAADALRTVVTDVGGVPHPRILAVPPARTEVLDVPPDDLEAWVERRVAEPLPMARCPYDSVLIRHADDDWSWFIDIHHVIVDAWGSALVFQATADAYDGRPVDLPSFADHLLSLDADSTTEAYAAAVAHWSAPRDPIPPTRFYRDRPETTRSHRVPVDFDRSRREALDRLLHDDLRPLSPGLGMLAALATVTIAYIHRLTRQPVVRIAVPVHHRRSPAARNTIGLLMELFPLEIQIDDGETLRSLNTKVDRGLVTLLRWARPGTSPRLDVDVVLNVITATCGSFGDMPTAAQWVHSGHVDPVHKLRVQYYDFTGDGEPILALDVNESVADRRHRERMPGHLLAVLDAFSTDPSTGLFDFPLVGDGERRQLVDDFIASGGSSLSPVRSVVADILPALTAIGDDVALVDGDLSIGGRDLAGRIVAVARWLADRGVGPGDRVGVRIERSAEAVIAVHGILQSGAAFVPLDPAYPDERLQHIVDDAGLALVIDHLPSSELDADDRRDVTPTPGAAVDLESEAYVLYTSGSTGQPKGVPISHRGLTEYVDFARRAYLEPTERPVVALVSSLSFDLTITSLFLPFVTGGCGVVYRGEGVTALRQLADDGRVTFLKATPSHLELLVRMIDDDHPLRTVVVGGEAFPRTLADRIVSVLPHVAIFNEYGPTEAVVGCMIHRYDPDADDGPDVPIGRPAPGVELYVLDDAGNLVPEGIVGELHIARPGLTAGYLNRPELDEQRFVNLAHLGGGRAYRSGDLVRFRDPATLEFLGRADAQMKVQGIRLEPAEVEAALLEHPRVTGVAVRLWESTRRKRIDRCRRCGLGSDVPDVSVEAGVCSVCRDYDSVRPQAERYFGTKDDLVSARDRARARRRGRYDALHLLSGGKDSSYALYQLVELGFEVFALTLDNGFISEGAKDNVRRIVADLGVDHEFVTTEAMNEIFRDSLERYSNVCNGCYKTIYTLAVNRAHELGIPMIVTGLSRGQFFETRLTPAQFARDRFDPASIDVAVLEARKVYHRTDDAVSRLLDVSLFDDDAIFDEIEFLDYYRYADVELDDMLAFLDRRAPWIRPADTGRSTNCLINAAGIYVHQIERGFHNYALPYSWDVRVGHKTRAEALEELDDHLDEDEVRRMLAEVGYEPRSRQVLTAWYVADGPPDVGIDPGELREHAAARLPAHAVPTAFVRVEAMPLSDNGKLDETLLPAPERRHREATTGYVAPEGPLETTLCEVWASVLSVDRVGAADDFFDLGGTSLDAIQMIVTISDTYRVRIPEDRAFRHRTIRELAGEVERIVIEAIEAMDDESVVRELEDGAGG